MHANCNASCLQKIPLPVLRIFSFLACLLYGGLAFCQTLIPYTDGSKWGYCDTAGHVRIQPQWERANFFWGNKAAVEIGKSQVDNYKRTHYSLIDTAGHYLVPAEYHWNGRWEGLARTRLNACDSRGRFGITDTNGRLWLPMEFEDDKLTWDSIVDARLRILKKDGYWGVRDSAGREVIPYRFEKIYTLIAHRRPGLLLGYFVINGGRWGLLDSNGKVLIKEQYHYLQELADTSVFGVVTYALDSSSGKVKQRAGLKLYPFKKYTLKPLYEEIRAVSANRFIVTKDSLNAVVDERGHLLLPYTSDELGAGKPGVIVQSRHLESHQYDVAYRRDLLRDATTLKPLSDWVPQFREWLGPICGNNEVTEMDEWWTRLPDLIVDGQRQKNFTRDGTYWELTGWYSGNYFAVHTSVSEKTQSVAIVDLNARFVFGPVKTSAKIVGYSPSLGLVTYHSDDEKTRYGPYKHSDYRSRLEDTSGKVLIRDALYPIMEICKVGGRIFLITGEGQCDYGLPLECSKKRLRNIKGELIENISSFDVLRLVNEHGVRSENGPFLMAKDSLGMEGMISIKGNVIYPKISFKSNRLIPVANGCFSIDDTVAYYRVLVDINGHNLFPGLSRTNFDHPSTQRLFPTDPLRPYEETPGLLRIVYVRRSDKKEGFFYMSKAGRVYTNGFERKNEVK